MNSRRGRLVVSLTVAGIVGMGSVAMCRAAEVGAEIQCNGGPVTVNSSGAVGVSAFGLSASYNPRSGEVCGGLSTQAGKAIYGKVSAQVCVRGDQTYVKGAGGVGVGVGADLMSAGCVAQGYVKVPVPRTMPAPAPGGPVRFPGLKPMPRAPVRY